MKRLVFLLFMAGCVKDPSTLAPDLPTPSAKGVFVVNEGTWGRGNASLSYYNLENFGVYNDLFSSVNGRSLGDVANQMVLYGGRGYIVVNNSDRIEIIDPSTSRSLGTISVGAGRSPRQIAFENDSLALVTALYDNSALLLQVATHQVVARIPVGANPEGIVITRGRAFVANSGLGTGSTLSVIDLATEHVVKTLTVGDNPTSVAISGDGMVYVVCGGFYNDYANPDDDTPAKLAVVDPSSLELADSLLLGGHASAIAISPGGLGYVVTTQGVLTIDTRSRRVVGMFASGTFYGVGVEDVSGDVYLTDPGDYLLPGRVLVYSASGQLRNSFTAGVIPGSMAFKR